MMEINHIAEENGGALSHNKKLSGIKFLFVGC